MRIVVGKQYIFLKLIINVDTQKSKDFFLFLFFSA